MTSFYREPEEIEKLGERLGDNEERILAGEAIMPGYQGAVQCCHK